MDDKEHNNCQHRKDIRVDNNLAGILVLVSRVHTETSHSLVNLIKRRNGNGQEESSKEESDQEESSKEEDGKEEDDEEEVVTAIAARSEEDI